jgi:hypothetical protein
MAGIPVIQVENGILPDFRKDEIQEAFLYGCNEENDSFTEIMDALEKQKLTIHYAIRIGGLDAGPV